MGFIAIALTAVLTIYLTSMPVSPTRNSSLPEVNPADFANISPAAGDVVPGGLSEIDPDADVFPPDTPLNKGEAYSVVRIYATELECKDATNTSCHYVACENAPDVGSETQERAIENACEANEKSGWRAVVPTADTTAIPEIVAPSP